MGDMRPVMSRAEEYVLRWRTRRGHETAVRYLDLLVVALKPRGWRFVRLYRPQEFPVPVPLLWIYASGAAGDVGLVVNVLATPGGTWAYHEAERGRKGHLAPCGDAKAAAEQVEALLKRRVFPGTW